MRITGYQMQSILRGAAVSIEVFGAAILLLRALEAQHCIRDPGTSPRHYVDPEWAVSKASAVVRSEKL